MGVYERFNNGQENIIQICKVRVIIVNSHDFYSSYIIQAIYLSSPDGILRSQSV